MPGRVAYAIVGAGPAGTRAAETIRRRDPDGRVVVISADPYPFYNRILLSKTFLESDDVAPEQVVMMPPEAYAERGIELRANERVERLDPEARTLELATGETLEYEKCLVASGARPRELPVPGGDRPEVHTLRSLTDAVALREAAGHAERVVVVGGGLIGVEVAAALRARDTPVTLVAREEWLFGHIAPRPVGRALEAVMEGGGVALRLKEVVTAVEPVEGGVRVVTAGGEVLEADLVVAGVGVRYNTGFLEGTDLVEPRAGIRVNAYLETEAAGLWAAGDVAAFDDPVLGSRRHVEHWLHAQHQGRHAGLGMTGERKPYRKVSSYDTELFGTGLLVLGAPELAGAWESTGLETGSGVAVGSDGERVVAAYRLGEPEVPAAELERRIESGERPA